MQHPVPSASLPQNLTSEMVSIQVGAQEHRHDHAGSTEQDASPHVLEDGGDSPMEGKSLPSKLPPYLQIMKNVLARSGPSFKT